MYHFLVFMYPMDRSINKCMDMLQHVWDKKTHLSFFFLSLTLFFFLLSIFSLSLSHTSFCLFCHTFPVRRVRYSLRVSVTVVAHIVTPRKKGLSFVFFHLATCLRSVYLDSCSSMDSILHRFIL